MPRRENTFRVDYSQFPKHLSHEEIHKFVVTELGLTRENVLQMQPSRRLGCTFVKVNNLELAEKIVEQHDGKHEFVFDGKSYKLRITMEDGTVEVTVFDLPEDVSNGEVATFLTEYGDVKNVRDLLWDDRYGELGGITTGVRIARVAVRKNIPSLVTIDGEETAVAYKGQRQTCLHCHEFAHIGIPCVQNRKLLVQKATADQSYANVAKAKPFQPTPAKPQSNAVVPRKPTPAVNTAQLLKVGQPSVSGAAPALLKSKTTMLPPAAPSMKSGKQTVIHLSPLPISIGTASAHQRPEGYETDSSQNSIASNGGRRHKRVQGPQGKKMRHVEASTTIINQPEYERASGDEMQQ